MRKRSSISLQLLTLASGAILIASSFTTNPSPAQEDLVKRPSQPETVLDFTQLAKKAIPAVVSIRVEAKRKSPFNNNPFFGSEFDSFGGDFWQFFGIPREMGNNSNPTLIGNASGVIVSPKGYILTNHHVVKEADNLIVQLNDGRKLPAKVLGTDSNSDLAVIKIDADNLPYLELGNSDDLEVGQWVAAIGNPLGLLQGTLTHGVVSAKGRNNLDIANLEDFIQTDAPIYRGNSGGPLMTLDGKVVGINTAMATNTSSGYIGVGFSIPSNIARHVLDDIISNGKVSRGFLGVSLQPIDYDLAQAFGLKKVEGALVTNVIKNSPADKAGLQAEDIILKYNDRPVENAAALRKAVYIMKPGTRLMLTVLRNEQLLQIPLEVGQYNKDQSENDLGETSSKQVELGIEVQELTPEIAKTLGYTNDQGVVITKVDPNGLGAWAGLKKGTLVLSVNRQKIENVSQFEEALRQTPKDRPVLLQLKMGDRHFFISVKSS